MTIEEKNLNRVFWHEIGHFVAKSINFQSFQISKVKEILIQGQLTTSGLDYDFEGDVIAELPKGVNKNSHTPIINLPEKIAELHYGCFFEAIFLNNDFTDCFNGVHGSCDLQDYAGALPGLRQRTGVNKLVDRYFDDLRDSEHLHLLPMKTPCDKYLIANGYKSYLVDLKLLLPDIKCTPLVGQNS